jgi:hypothetical protein
MIWWNVIELLLKLNILLWRAVIVKAADLGGRESLRGRLLYRVRHLVLIDEFAFISRLSPAVNLIFLGLCISIWSNLLLLNQIVASHLSFVNLLKLLSGFHELVFIFSIETGDVLWHLILHARVQIRVLIGGRLDDLWRRQLRVRSLLVVNHRVLLLRGLVALRVLRPKDGVEIQVFAVLNRCVLELLSKHCNLRLVVQVVREKSLLRV